jgi:hypothetical protein
MELHVEHNDPDAAWGHIGPVVIVLWKRAITADALDRFVIYSNAHGARFPSGWAVLSYPNPKMQLPPPELRKRIADLTSNPGANYAGTTTVVDAEGFQASVMRSVLAGFALMGGKGAPKHVARTSDEGVDYLATLVKFDVDATKHAVREFVKQARA